MHVDWFEKFSVVIYMLYVFLYFYSDKDYDIAASQYTSLSSVTAEGALIVNSVSEISDTQHLATSLCVPVKNTRTGALNKPWLTTTLVFPLDIVAVPELSDFLSPIVHLLNVIPDSVPSLLNEFKQQFSKCMFDGESWKTCQGV